MPDEPEVRPVREDDAAAISAIYPHQVCQGIASFDEEAPTETETRATIRRISGHGRPFLVAELDGTIAGYAYATQFRDRPAYPFTCENSIYVHPDRTGRGVGRRLLTRLIGEAEADGFRQMIGVIGGGEPASVGFAPEPWLLRGWAHALSRSKVRPMVGHRLYAARFGSGRHVRAGARLRLKG